MKIKNTLNFKCSRCGGAKYIDDPYLISSTWFVDVSCLSCGDSKSIEADRLQELINKIERSNKIANR